MRLAHQEPTQGRIALAQTRDVAVNAALVVVEDRVGVRGGEVKFDIGLDLAIGARRARVEEDAALLAGEIPLGAAAMSKADRRARAGREGMGVQRDAGQVAGAALAVDKGLVERALAVQRAADGATLQVPHHGPDALAADAQRHLGARDHEGARETARHDRAAWAARRRSRRRHLGELVDPPLQQFLVGAKIA